MSSRISVLTMLITLTAWSALIGLAGCASSGQDQNYKVLEEDRPMFDTRPNTNQPGESRALPSTPSNFVVTAPAPGVPPEVEMKAAGPKPVNDEQSAVDGDASGSTANGELKTSTPTSAETTGEDKKTVEQVQDAIAAAPVSQRSITGLDRSHWATVTVGPDLSSSYLPSYFHEVDPKTDVWCLVAFERLCFVAQVAALPVKMVITPPWTRFKSTSKEAGAYCDSHDQCCSAMDKMSAAQAPAALAAGENTSNLKTGCAQGNHTGCMLCNCTSLKSTDEHTCDKCCG